MEKVSNRVLYALVEILELSHLSLSDGVCRKTAAIMPAHDVVKAPHHARSSFYAVRETWEKFGLLAINIQFNTKSEECIILM
jgi:hypothetical protein